MKNFYKIFISFFILTSLVLFNSCDPFEDTYITLSMNTEFNISGVGIGLDLSKKENFCLSKFDDYNDNKDKLEEIRYISSAYLTIDSTQELRGDSLTLTLYEGDGLTLLFKYVVPNFNANQYLNKPLEIKLTPKEIDDINAYLKNPREDKCFVATLKVSNVQSTNPFFQLNSKIEFLSELKIRP